MQRGVTALLEALIHHELAVLPMARQPGSPATTPPSLMLLKDLLIQVSLVPLLQTMVSAFCIMSENLSACYRHQHVCLASSSHVLCTTLERSEAMVHLQYAVKLQQA